MKRLALILLMVCAVTGAASADHILTMKTKHLGDGTVDEGMMYLSKDKLKVDTPEDEGMIVFDRKAQTVYIVDHSRKSYMSMDKESMDKMAGKMNEGMADAMKQAEEALKNLPEEQRKMAEKYMKDAMGATPGQAPGAAAASKPSVKKTGDEKTIEGKPCRRIEVSKDGSLTQDMWVTDWKNVKMGKDDVQILMDFGEFMTEMLASIPQAGSQSDMNFFQVFEQLGGCPVHVAQYDDGKVTEETTLTSVEKTSFDASTFAIPDGYKLQDPMAGMQ